MFFVSDGVTLTLLPMHDVRPVFLLLFFGSVTTRGRYKTIVLRQNDDTDGTRRTAPLDCIVGP